MNFITKTKFLIAVIIVLSAIILAIFGSMIVHRLRYDRVLNEKVGQENRLREANQMGKYMAKQLQLSPEQVTQIDTLRAKFHKESDALVKETKSISKDIMEEINSENPENNKLKDLAQKFGKLQEAQKQMMINHFLEVRSKCTPTQQLNFRKFIRQIEKHEQMRRNRNDEGKKRN